MTFVAANFIVFLWFSLLVQKYNEAKDEKESKLTPPLIVISISESIYKEKRIYEMINVGQGAAINVLSSRVELMSTTKRILCGKHRLCATVCFQTIPKTCDGLTIHGQSY